ncbi:MAG: hypothetical protein AAGJ74_14630 [Pseudomonadota bacterium]
MRVAMVGAPFKLLVACAPQEPAELSPLFKKQNDCFVPAGKPPIEGLYGGYELTQEEAAIYEECMARP